MTIPRPSPALCALFFVEDLISCVLNIYGFTWFPSRMYEQQQQQLQWELSQYVFLPYLAQLLINTGNAYEDDMSESVYGIFMPVMTHPSFTRNRLLLATILNQLPCDFDSDGWIYDLFFYMAVLVELAVHFFLSGRYELFETTLSAMAVIISSRIPGGFRGGLTAIRNFVRATILNYRVNDCSI